MSPLFGFLIFFVLVIIVSIVAAKRGLRWWPYLVGCLIAAPILVNLSARTGASSFTAGVVALLIPVIALILVLTRKNSEQLAISEGSHGDFRKCPFCAEAVRREARKCKHCGSELTPEHG